MGMEAALPLGSGRDCAMGTAGSGLDLAGRRLLERRNLGCGFNAPMVERVGRGAARWGVETADARRRGGGPSGVG